MNLRHQFPVGCKIVITHLNVDGAPLLWRKADRVGVDHPGEEKDPKRLLRVPPKADEVL